MAVPPRLGLSPSFSCGERGSRSQGEVLCLASAHAGHAFRLVPAAPSPWAQKYMVLVAMEQTRGKQGVFVPTEQGGMTVLSVSNVQSFPAP